MKKIILGLIIGVLLTTPIITFSASSLASRLKGKILLAVEDHGKTYYVHEDGSRYRITVATAQKIFEKLALGITNKDLEEIPIKDVGINPEADVAGVKIKKEYIYINKQCNYEPYTSQVLKLTKELNETKNIVKEYEKMMKEALDVAEQWKANAEAWKAKANELSDSSYMPQYQEPASLFIKCFTGLDGSVACYDMAQFPPDLLAKLKEYEQSLIGRGILSSVAEAKKLQIIKEYYGY